MSDVSHGPGWWQASDGKWYAPELHPNYQPPVPPPPPRQTAVPPTEPQWSQQSQGQPRYSHGGSSRVGAGTGFSLGSIKLLPGIVIGAGALLILGSVLPWATVSTAFLSLSVNGTAGDGGITLTLGIVALVIGVLLVRGFVATGWLIGVGVIFLIALGVSLHDASDVSSVSSQLSQDVGVSVGIGLWLCLLASVSGLVATIVIFTQRRKVEQSGRSASFVAGAEPTGGGQGAPYGAQTAPPGPGWWQASNGAWYPPESHPNFVMPMPPTNDSPGTSPH